MQTGWVNDLRCVATSLRCGIKVFVIQHATRRSHSATGSPKENTSGRCLYIWTTSRWRLSGKSHIPSLEHAETYCSVRALNDPNCPLSKTGSDLTMGHENRIETPRGIVPSAFIHWKMCDSSEYSQGWASQVEQSRTGKGPIITYC